ncbi:MAG: hypothetical protein ACKV2T_20410 [Kofleriaceae bacterium]
MARAPVLRQEGRDLRDRVDDGLVGAGDAELVDCKAGPEVERWLARHATTKETPAKSGEGGTVDLEIVEVAHDEAIQTSELNVRDET